MIKKTSGFTIVELLIYIALLSIFMVVLLDIFTTTLNMKLSGENASSINQDARYILARLSYDIYNADSVSTPGTLGQQTTSLQIVKSGVTTTLQLDGSNNLTETVGGSTLKLNGNDTKVNTITFKRLGSIGEKPTIQIGYTIESQIIVSGGPKTQTVNTTLGLR